MKQEELTNQVEDTIENGTPEQVQNIAQNAPEPIANEAKQTLDNNPRNDEVNKAKIEEAIDEDKTIVDTDRYNKPKYEYYGNRRYKVPEGVVVSKEMARDFVNRRTSPETFQKFITTLGDQKLILPPEDSDHFAGLTKEETDWLTGLKGSDFGDDEVLKRYLKLAKGSNASKEENAETIGDPVNNLALSGFEEGMEDEESSEYLNDLFGPFTPKKKLLRQINKNYVEGGEGEELSDLEKEVYYATPEKLRGMLGPRVEKAIEENPEQILEDPEMPEEAKEEAAQVLDSDNRTDEANNEQVEEAVEKLSEDFDTVDDLYNYLDQFGDEYGFVEEPDNKTFDEGQMISESNAGFPEEEVPVEDETIVDDGVTDYDYSDIPDPDILSQEEVQQIAFDSIQSDETLDDTTKDQLLDDVASEIDWLVGLGKAKPKMNEESGQEWIDKASKADAYMMNGATADEALDMANLEDEISTNMPFDPNILFGENNVDVVEESIEQEPDPERKARKLRLAEYFKSKATDVGGSGMGSVSQAPTTPEDRRRSVGGSFGGFKPIMSSLGLGYSSGSSAGTAPSPKETSVPTRNISSGRSNLLDRGTGSESTIKAGSVGANSSSGNKTFNGGLFGSGSTQKSSRLSKGSVKLPSGGGHTAPAGGGKLAKGKETLSGRKSTGDINMDKLVSMIVSDSKNWPVNKEGNKDSEDRFSPFKLQITEENQILVKGSGLRGAHFETAIAKNPELLKAIRAYFAG